MKPTILPYRDSDAPSVIRLSLRAWAPVFASMREVLGDQIFGHLYGDDWQLRQQSEVEKVLAEEKTKLWIAEEDNQVTGFVAAFLRADENMGEIHMLSVEPDHQNRGLGSELTEVATDWIRDSEIPLPSSRRAEISAMLRLAAPTRRSALRRFPRCSTSKRSKAHTVASLSTRAGASVKSVQSQLGHASATMTLDRYSHLWPDELEALSDALDVVAARATPDSLRTPGPAGEIVALADRG